MRSPCCMCVLLGNGSVKTVRQRMHTQHKNCWMQCFLWGPCIIKYSICGERKVGDKFFPELLVFYILKVQYLISKEET
jgi:hypothetical protein